MRNLNAMAQSVKKLYCFYKKKKERSIRVIERFNENSKQKLIQGLYSQLENHGKKATEMYWFQDKISETIPGNWMLWY